MIRQTPTDYRNLNNWMEIPRHLDYKVDIFYLYPTAYFKSAASPMICSVNHQAMRDRATDHLTHKGSAFRTVGNYFVPFYRQAAIQCLLSEKEEDTQDFFDQTVTDVCTAFDYYLKNLNGGRPFILAGHSQGSILLSILLATTFKKHPHYLHQLVAAYIIGYGITPKYLADNPHLSFATGATDTGVIISYNTEAPGVKGENITLPAGSMAINPISWGWRCCTPPHLGWHPPCPPAPWPSTPSPGHGMRPPPQPAAAVAPTSS